MAKLDKPRPRVALLTGDPTLYAHAATALRGFEVTNETANAAAIVVEIKAHQTALPPLPPNKPVLALVPTRTFEAARSLFLAGAADVLAFNAAPGTLRDAVERLVFGAPVPPVAAPGLANELFFLREVSEAVAEGAALHWLFDRIVEIVAESLGVDIVSLMLIESDPAAQQDVLLIKAARGLSADIIRKARVELGRGVSGLVASRGEPLLLADVERANVGVSLSHPRYANRSLLSAPIKARSQTIGVLNVNNKAGGATFDERDQALLAILCSQAGMAIDNARLYDELSRHAKRLAELNARLHRVNQAKSELIVNLSHELKTPLTAISGYLDLLRAGMVEPARLPDVLTKVHDRSRHLSRLAERLLVYFALDSRLANFFREPFSLLDLARECVAELRAKAEAKQVRLELDEDSLRQTVVADRQYYREALASLLDNAVKFNRKDGLARLTGRPAPGREADQWEMIVQDEGPGVPENLREAIFEEFTQTDDILTAKPDGLGLGLAIARAVCERHGCRLRLIETSAAGSAFALGAPLHE